ncbi:hypothetical protein [Streptomyces tanashiensis]|uniref:Uncharacterized protein n=1 Tax=Streptomyces tanashiensis TaxID=67367 RepID=A0ABY6QP71_9ACTN|nr:hypothetical protein [Streptomyces tanashiensis]UZX19605.1 hypothetical protein LDH80_02115 [Streptomyces tanashiensis]GGY18112.1 hypothetical protein GCM10010299_24500 [Streptomyces tanashiensis]
MGLQERERKMYRPLRRAGLEVIPDAVPDGTMPFVFGSRPEDVVGRFSHPYETPRLVERLNEDWYELAVSTGLLDHRREFLVMLPQVVGTHGATLPHMRSGRRAAPAAWTRVRLLDRWDIMGRGAGSAFLGIRAGHPGFGMLALDSSVYIGCSTGEMGVDVVAVGHPDRSENVLRELEWLAQWDSPYNNREVRERITVWLAGRTRRAVSPSGDSDDGDSRT